MGTLQRREAPEEGQAGGVAEETHVCSLLRLQGANLPALRAQRDHCEHQHLHPDVEEVPEVAP